MKGSETRDGELRPVLLPGTRSPHNWVWSRHFWNEVADGVYNPIDALKEDIDFIDRFPWMSRPPDEWAYDKEADIESVKRMRGL